MVSRTVAGAYDAVNGGFGSAPKFPNGPIVDFLVHMARTTGEEFYRVMLEKTLDSMSSSPLYDSEEADSFDTPPTPTGPAPSGKNCWKTT